MSSITICKFLGGSAHFLVICEVSSENPNLNLPLQMPSILATSQEQLATSLKGILKITNLIMPVTNYLISRFQVSSEYPNLNLSLQMPFILATLQEQ